MQTLLHKKKGGADGSIKFLPPLTKRLLALIGITDGKSANLFLKPDYETGLHDPFLMKGMGRAVDRIIEAIEKKEKIIIYNDYDCDGIPGGVIFHDFLKKIKFENFSNYIPHRYSEGYGLNINAINHFINENVRLIITIDCGITDVEEVELAQKNGIDVIITDHHLPVENHNDGGQILPPAYAVINNKQYDDPYPFKELCGAGTVFKLIQALLKKLGSENKTANITRGWEKWLLDMAGLATIADMVPLVGENRVIAYYGLKVLRKSPRPGLQNLLRRAYVRQNTLNEDDVGFMIAPRINAASRMGEPKEAFCLLSTRDSSIGAALAEKLHKLNSRRKGVVAAMVKEAKAKLQKRFIETDPPLIVLGNTAWMPGLLGLAANSLVEEYNRPVFLWGRYGSKTIKGSCRSDGSVNVVKLMDAVHKNIFLDFGGHELSGGFSVSQDYIHTLETALFDAHNSIYDKNGCLEKSSEEKNRNNYIKMGLSEIIWETYAEIETLAPFGIGNPKPTFLFENIEIAQIRRFGHNNSHLELKFYNPEVTGGSDMKIQKTMFPVSAVGFFVYTRALPDHIKIGTRINLAAHIEISYFRTHPELRLRIVDIF